MKNKAITLSILACLLFPLFVIGPEQYGYAFFGCLNIIGRLTEALGATSPIWMVIFPLLTIVVMAAFSFLGVACFVCPVTLLFVRFKEKTKKRMKLPPVIFAFVVLIGLACFVAFPGEPKIEIGSDFFIAPSILLLVSVCSILLKDKAEPGIGINSVTAPPPLRDTL
mgnify:CR=1 FL=1|tara:strand:+ start:570 stop:1070 length:501 start_codon:yes stop_codon:yes gene_type:complete